MGMQQTSVHGRTYYATGQTGKTAHGNPLYLRQGLLRDHSGMEGVPSTNIFESSGLRKQE